MSKKIKKDSRNHDKLINQKAELQKKIKKMGTELDELTFLNNELKQKLSIAYDEVTYQKELNETNNKVIEEILSKNESLLNRTIILTKTKLNLLKDYDNEIQNITNQKLELEEKIGIIMNQKLELEEKINKIKIEQSNATNSIQFNELNQKLEKINIQLNQEIEKNSHYTKQIKELNNQLNQEIEKNSHYTKQIKELNNQLNQVIEKNSHYTKQIKELNNQLNQVIENKTYAQLPIINDEQDLENKIKFINYINKINDNDLNKIRTLIKLINKQYSDLTVAIKTPSPTTNRTWGDYFFALSLKKSLEKKGFNVIIHELEHWARDDSEIVIVLRGLTEYNTKPQHLNFMWNISHPDDVSIEEYEKYDIVFVASDKYANSLKKQVNALVHPLLQCTDPTNFFPEKNDEFNEEILFVGITRKVFRKIVRDTLETKHDFSVYGRGWEEFIDSKYIKGNFIDNDILNKAYSNCKILLNDHWEDMITNEFVSNRLFDALACKTFVISDYIPAIQTLFEGSVVTYTDSKDLNEKLDYYLTHENERMELADRGYHIVLKKHTFDHRVDEILDVIEKKFYSRFINQCEIDWNVNANSEEQKINNVYGLFNIFFNNNYQDIVNENRAKTLEIARLQEKIYYLEQEKIFNEIENNKPKKTKNAIGFFKSHI